jgi:hypothetical protein
MKSFLILLLILIAKPSDAQTKVWTNADLGRPLRNDRPTPSDAELTGLTAHAYHYAEPEPGPTFGVVYSGAYDALPVPWPMFGGVYYGVSRRSCRVSGCYLRGNHSTNRYPSRENWGNTFQYYRVDGRSNGVQRYTPRVYAQPHHPQLQTVK